MTVTVPEVKPAEVSRRRALRLFIGKFLVDYIETFAGLIPAQFVIAIVTPAGAAAWLADWRAYLIQLAGPALAAFVSSARRAWPAIKKALAPDAP